MQKRNNPLELKVKASDAAERTAGEWQDTDVTMEAQPVFTENAAAVQKEARETIPANGMKADLAVGEDATAETYDEDEYMMASRFALVGKIKRKTVLCRVNRQLCERMRSLHPGRDMNRIIEDALLTRLYLESRDAFDEVAVSIENGGGHIKC